MKKALKNKKQDINLKASKTQLKKFIEACKEHECEVKVDKKKLEKVIKNVVDKE